MTDATPKVMGFSAVTMLNPAEHPEIAAVMEGMLTESLRRYIEEQNHEPVGEEIATRIDESEEYHLVVDENDEPIVDEDGRFVWDTSRPTYTVYRMTAERPVREKGVAHA